MESLGFTESPSVSYVSTQIKPATEPSRLVSTATHRVITVEEMWDTTELHADSLVDWKPKDVNDRKLNKRFRWKLAAGWVLLLGILGAAGYWLYSAPGDAADQAIQDLRINGEALENVLAPLQVAVVDLSPELEEITLALAEATANVDSASRELFTSAANVPDGGDAVRSHATDAATISLSASKSVNTIAAYLGAIVPILTGPSLETDPEIADLADAAAQFAQWQSHFDSVRGVLPDSVLIPVTEALDTLSVELSLIQTTYLDSLREGDRVGALDSVRALEGRLSEVWSMLLTETEVAKTAIAAEIESAGESLDLLAG